MKVYRYKTQFLKSLVFLLAIATSGTNLYAKENVRNREEKRTSTNQTAIGQILQKGSGCTVGSQQKELSINNVRTRILNGGDMWWDLQSAKYEIPKVPAGQVSKNSLFAGALWIGGVSSGNLRLAAQTYRQGGSDYFPGPLIAGSATISSSRCKDFDKIWKIQLQEIVNFQNDAQAAVDANNDFLTWPGNGKVSEGEAAFLAPYYNAPSDEAKGIINDPNLYEPEKGDFPSLDQNRKDNIPDEMIYILYNDKGNVHTETGGLPIGLELHTQCFAFATNNELNNTTLYRTTIYNRGNETIDSCVFGQWVDPDLGNYTDDYVECDLAVDPVNNVPRNLGICYNGDDNDEGVFGYGLNPPSIGVRFFEGPKKADGTLLGMTKFIYYNNDFSVIGNPNRPSDYWGYLNGRWKDNKVITYGGNGRDGADTASFMFPGKTDPAGRINWTERTANNAPGDRRFLQTSGPFSMLPGAVNKVTVGVVWARATTGGATGSFNLLKTASDRAYQLFKADFVNPKSPIAPDVTITELNRELILTLKNYKTTESFVDTIKGPCNEKTKIKFQGYKIYQLKNNNSGADLSDPTQAKLVAQCDIQDEYTRLTNVVRDIDLGQSYKVVQVDGENKGIRHTFSLTQDAFSTLSDRRFVNFNEYHFLLVAYANPVNCPIVEEQYISGSTNISTGTSLVHTGTPHDPTPRAEGSVLNSSLNTGPEITRVEGIGNGGNVIRLSRKSIEECLTSPNYASVTPTYEKGYSPVTIRVFDPFKVPLADFELKLVDSSSYGNKVDSISAPSTRWYLTKLGPNSKTISSEVAISVNNEQIIEEWGLALNVTSTIRPGNQTSQFDLTNGFISGELTYANTSNRWLTGVVDEDANYLTSMGYPESVTIPFNWIRSGASGKSNNYNDPLRNDFSIGGEAMDAGKNYGKILGGTWAPYGLAAKEVSTNTPTLGPGCKITTGGGSTDNTLNDLQSVDIVFTNDRSKWSRCAVVETGELAAFNVGNADKFDLRASPSVDKFGKPDGTGNGMGWFPGYAINVETGERLNIMFGEDSSIPSENGNDMIWNPTKNLLSKNFLSPVFGGKHYVYIMGNKKFKSGTKEVGTKYDLCASYASILSDAGISNKSLRKRLVFSQAMWVTMPLVKNDRNVSLASVEGGIVPNEVTVRLRVKRPYAKYINSLTTTPLANDSAPLYRFSTASVFPDKANSDAAKKALDMITVSPNPYYAYAGYENPNNQLDTKVKIINLPNKCTVSIFTMNGFLVRRFKKDDDKTHLDWDLKNEALVPIVSGIYLVHIDAPNMGERVIKWFGIMRPVDFDTF